MNPVGMRYWVKMTGIVIVMVLFFASGAAAVTDILEGAVVMASPKSVAKIIAVFERSEEALGEENLEKIMGFYSKDYKNWGLQKEDTSKIWEDLFVRYDDLSSRHVFSKIIVNSKKGTAQVTCTGAIFGVSQLQRKGQPMPAGAVSTTMIIDSWFEAVHHLVKENGSWRLIGHNPVVGERDSFGAGIHLLF